MRDVYIPPLNNLKNPYYALEDPEINMILKK
jgi:hypothetical protein